MVSHCLTQYIIRNSHSEKSDEITKSLYLQDYTLFQSYGIKDDSKYIINIFLKMCFYETIKKNCIIASLIVRRDLEKI